MKGVPVIMTRINPLSSFAFTANCTDISAIGPKELMCSMDSHIQVLIESFGDVVKHGGTDVLLFLFS